MEEKVIKKESKFIDNIAYKNKFQFLLWVNDNAICQRYFKINGFVEESIYSEQFQECMNEIVNEIQNDLKSKSNVFMWYTNTNEPLKMVGFLSDDEIEKFGADFFSIVNNKDIVGSVKRPDGKTMEKTYFNYPEGIINDFGDSERPADGEITFKFSFLIDDVVVFERIWDGNVYPRFVRNGVDLTNSTAFYTHKDINSLPIGQQFLHKMQAGKTNLISDFIHKICDTLSNTFTEKYIYTKNADYKNNNVIDKEKYDNAVKFYGGSIKPNVIGHIDIQEKDKTYDYLSSFESYKKSWAKAVKEKTNKYFYLDDFYLQKSLDYWNNH